MTTVLTPTPAAPGPLPQPAPEQDEAVWPLSVEQYHAMIRAGILDDGDPVELLEGFLIQKMAKNPPHCRTRRLLVKALAPILPPGWDVDTQGAITTLDSEPEPDVFVYRSRDDDYADSHPGPPDLALVVEVADSSLRRDRGRKKRLYARAAIREYWIVNLIDRQVEVYTSPTGPADEQDYNQRRDYRPAEQVPVVVDGREVGRLTVSDLLP